MGLANLQKLNAAVESLINQSAFLRIVDKLREDIDHSHEPFVWSVVDLNSVGRELPESIKSCWIFVLKKNVPSGCHYHPNSIQHMVVISGRGTSRVAGEQKRMIQFGAANASLPEVWYVIDKGVRHEFLPEEEEMVVVSFHTCEANELLEISCGTGERRIYEESSDVFNRNQVVRSAKH